MHLCIIIRTFTFNDGMNHKGKTLHIQPKDEKDGKFFTIYLIYKYGHTQIYNYTPTQKKKSATYVRIRFITRKTLAQKRRMISVKNVMSKKICTANVG